MAMTKFSHFVVDIVWMDVVPKTGSTGGLRVREQGGSPTGGKPATCGGRRLGGFHVDMSALPLWDGYAKSTEQVDRRKINHWNLE